jgi:hypothetical protein
MVSYLGTPERVAMTPPFPGTHGFVFHVTVVLPVVVVSLEVVPPHVHAPPLN